MHVWDDVIPEEVKLVYEKAGFGGKMGLGKKPALLIIDMNYNWTGQRGVPLLDLIERYPFACGEVGWKAVDLLAELLPIGREKGVPIIYTTGDPRGITAPAAASKSRRSPEARRIEGGNEIVSEIAPQRDDLVIYKQKASAFFGTPLASILYGLGIDTVVCCGTSSSGCLRASVIDACAYNFRVAVIEECSYDRAEITHKVNMFDMNAKYADVIPIEEVRRYILSL